MATVRRRTHEDPISLFFGHLVATIPAPPEERGYPSTLEEFIRVELGIELYDKQLEIARSVQANRRTAVKSCHAGGKSVLIAAVTIAFLHIYPNSKVVITGPSKEHVQDIVWGNIRAMYERAPGHLVGRPGLLRWRLAPDWYAVGIKPSDYRPGSIQGHHAPHVLLIADEAAEVPKPILDGLETLMTGGDAHILLCGNPTESSGTFHAAFHEQSALWHGMSIASTDTPNIKAGRIVVPGLLDQQWIDEQIAIWGADHDWVRARVHAEFPQNQANAWVALAHIERARARTQSGEIAFDPTEPIDVGIDVARTGDDKSVLAFRAGPFVLDEIEWKLGNLMESVGAVRDELEQMRDKIIRQYDRTPDQARFRFINVDETGLGGGMVDRLIELHRDGELPCEHVTGVNFAAKSSDSESWQNTRQELWSGLRERFREDRIGGHFSQLFAADVTAAHQRHHSTYKMPQVESKEDMKKRLHRSPDHGDAVALAFWVPIALRSVQSVAPVSVVSSVAPHWAADWYDEHEEQ